VNKRFSVEIVTGGWNAAGGRKPAVSYWESFPSRGLSKIGL